MDGIAMSCHFYYIRYLIQEAGWEYFAVVLIDHFIPLKSQAPKIKRPVTDPFLWICGNRSSFISGTE